MAREKPNDPAATDVPPVPVYADPYDKQRLYEKQGYYGVMFAPEYSWDTHRCIEEAYGDARSTPRSMAIGGQRRRSLRFHTGWLDVEDAMHHVTAIPSYNRFHPYAAADAIRRFPRTASVAIGRESSPVLYVWTANARTVIDALDDIPYDEDHDEDGPFAPAPPDELGAVPESEVSSYPVRVVGNSRETVSDGQPMLVRAWWD